MRVANAVVVIAALACCGACGDDSSTSVDPPTAADPIDVRGSGGDSSAPGAAIASPEPVEDPESLVRAAMDHLYEVGVVKLDMHVDIRPDGSTTHHVSPPMPDEKALWARIELAIVDLAAQYTEHPDAAAELLAEEFADEAARRCGNALLALEHCDAELCSRLAAVASLGNLREGDWGQLLSAVRSAGGSLDFYAQKRALREGSDIARGLVVAMAGDDVAAGQADQLLILCEAWDFVVAGRLDEQTVSAAMRTAINTAGPSVSAKEVIALAEQRASRPDWSRRLRVLARIIEEHASDDGRITAATIGEFMKQLTEAWRGLD